MGKGLRDSRLRVDDEAEQSIDFKHRKWEFPIMAKVRAPNVYVCVIPNIEKIEPTKIIAGSRP